MTLNLNPLIRNRTLPRVRRVRVRGEHLLVRRHLTDIYSVVMGDLSSRDGPNWQLFAWATGNEQRIYSWVGTALGFRIG
jgi:hypothetical protein